MHLPDPTRWSFESLLDGDPQSIAFECNDHTASRRELVQAGRRAAALLHSLGLRRGDVICVWLPDGGAWLQFLLGAAQLGILMVPISTRYRESEALHVVSTARAKAIVVATDFLDFDFLTPARSIAAQLGHVEHLIEVATSRGFHPVREDLATAPSSGQAEDALCTFSTSGTTGHPKLAVHDQASIVRHARNVARLMEIGPGDVTLSVLSLYGVLGFVQSMAALAGGAKCVYMQVFKAEPAAAAMASKRVTHLFGSDGIFAPILAVPGVDLSSWRRGGFAEFSGMAAKVIRNAEDRQGLRLVGLYGSSECFALTATQLHSDPAEQRALAGGRPTADGIRFRVVHPETGAPLAEGERGELQIKGFNVMSGYLNNPTSTAAAFTTDGWFRTGDLAYTQGDRFVYLSRLKDGLRLRGYLVDPVEIEEALGRHPGVLDAQVVGVNRPGIGDQAVAFVRLKSALSEDELSAWCRQQIASYKVPSRVVFVDDYPRVEGPNGTKILKNRLRDQAVQLIGEAA
jgi:acyl-CoA synthetase (AMP-forming)/AMP-acid ligase II